MNNCTSCFNRIIRVTAFGLGLFLITLVATPAGAQPNTTVIPYLGMGYKYKQVSFNQLPGFESPGFADGAWLTGNAGFGTLGPTCPLNTSAYVKTIWSKRTDMLVRKRFTLPPGTRNLTVGVAIGNDVQVFLNGRDISGGLLTREGCAARNSLVLTAPDSLLLPGDNLIAVRGRGRGNETYLDIEVRADLPRTYTITASASLGATISPSGAVTVVSGANQSFSLSSATGYHIDSVLVDGVNQGVVGAYTFTSVTANHTIAAYSSVNTYTIVASASAGGSIAPSGTVTLNHGSNRTFIIAANTGYHIDSVLVDGTNQGAIESYTFNGVTGNHAIAAYFSINTYTITSSAGPNGSISPDGVVGVNYGSTRTYLILPATGYHVDSVVVDGVKVDSAGSYTFTDVASSHTIRAVFAINQYVIAASAGSNGTISPSGTIVVSHGAGASFIIAPDLYYYIKDVLVDGVSVGAAAAYNFTNVTGPHSISASFYSTAVVVASLADTGSGTLREAIGITNEDPILDTIKFALPGSGVRTITLNSSLPIVIDSLVIDGYTQPLTFGGDLSPEASSGPLIELNGNGVAQHGLILAAANVTVRGLIINRCMESGILVTGNSATIEGNYIGTDATGTVDLGNGKDGILVNGASQARIGSHGVHGPNLLSGNNRNGIRLENATGAVIESNLIGTEVTGELPLPNGGDGIALASGSTGNTVGTGNIIAFNAGNGITLLPGFGNALSGNSIFENSGLGIDVGSNGVTESGIVLSTAAFDLNSVAGNLSGSPSSTYRIEFFESNIPDPSGFGEGRRYLGNGVVTTDSTGLAEFYLEIPGPMDSYRFVTATATDQSNNTSEFSGAIQSVAKVKIYGEHYVINTTFSGIPLHWAEGKAAFQISNSVPVIYQDAMKRGYGVWDSLPQLAYTFDGTTDNSTWGGPTDGRNLAVWVSSGWEDLTGLDSTAVAVTRTRYNALNGQISDADIAFDAEHFGWEISATGPVTANMDVENTTAHEVGHFGGLGDIYNPGEPGYLSVMATGNQDVTMYGLINFGETAKRSLEDPDSIAIATLYGLVPPSRVDLVLVFDPSSSYSISQGAFEPSRNSALELIPKMRTGDRLGVVLMPNTVVLPLTVMGDSSGQAQAQAAINSLAVGGLSAIGSGLQTAQGQLDFAPLQSNARAMLLYSAGEEDAAPSALSVLGPILTAQTRVFTLGFPGSYGQALCNQLADTTGGSYHISADSSVNQAVNEIWNNLADQQYSFVTVASSDTFGTAPFPGIQWQGPVDKGSTSALPGIQWQGPKGTALANSPDALPPTSSYILSLLPPGGSTLIDSAYVANNPGLGIKFFSGETFQYFSISNPLPGNWSLYVYQRSGPLEAEPVLVSITAVTDLVMEADINQLSYAPGATVVMSVTLSNGGVVAGGRHVTGGGPITDAVVTGKISPPGGGAPSLVSFIHQGVGVYRASFSGTSAPGTYNAVFSASRDTVHRTAARSFYVVPEFDGRAVLLANRSIGMDPGAVVSSGDIIVNGSRLNGTYELTLSGGASTPAGYNVKASDVLVQSGGLISGTVTYNSLVNNGTVTGAQQSPLTLPVLSALPPFKSSTPGITDVTVKTRRSLTLAAGNYRDVSVEPSAKLTLSGGVYHFRSLTVKSGAKVLASAQVEVRILNGCNADNSAYIGPAQGSLIDARRIVIYVAGADGATPNYPQAVTISPYGQVFANLYAPFGTVALRQGAIASGAFIANDIILGQNATVALASAFAPGLNVTAIPWAMEPGASESDESAPGAFRLDQNFPNPFNPSTTIRFALPLNSHVGIEVFNTLGQRVSTLLNEERKAGNYLVEWDGTGDQKQVLGGGVYFLRLSASAQGGIFFTETRKLVLLK